MQLVLDLIVPGILVGVSSYGMAKKVDVYDALLQGAAKGLEILLRILPALVTLLTVTAMLRASGALDLAAEALAPALRWLGNTVFMAVMAMLLTCITASMAGYALAKKRFPGRALVFSIMICAMALPKQVILIPLLKEMSFFNLHDNIWSVILPTVGWPFGVFLMKQFSETIPGEMLEAARIDGAGEALTFAKIVLPMVTPGIGALAIFTFINSWNDYFLQLIMLSSRNNLTISLGIAKLQAEMSNDFGLIMAGAALAAIPIIAVFLAFQKYFTQGIAMGAVKG